MSLDKFRTRNSKNKNKFYEKSLIVLVEDFTYELKTYDRQDNLIIEYNEDLITVDSDYRSGNPITHININNKEYVFKVIKLINGYNISGYGYSSDLKNLSKKAYNLSKYMIKKESQSNDKIVKCPMPGLVISIDVVENQEVESGDKLCTIEAMKMENIIRAELSGKVKKIHCENGDSLSSDQVILEFF